MIPRIEQLTEELCGEIDYLREELARVTNERDHWRDKYMGQLKSEEEHHKTMMRGVLTTLIAEPKHEKTKTS